MVRILTEESDLNTRRNEGMSFNFSAWFIKAMRFMHVKHYERDRNASV
jgi:hypothetical protein